MRKKKYLIILSTFLLVALLGLFSPTYASSFSVNSVKTALQHLKDNGYLTSFNIDTATGSTNFKNGINNNQYVSFAIIKKINDTRIYCATYWAQNGNTNASGSLWTWDANGNSQSNSWGNTTQLTTANIEIAYSPNRNQTNIETSAGQIYDINTPVITWEFTPEYIAQTTGNPVLNINKFDYITNRINLGVIQDIDYYSIEIRFKDDNGLIIGSDLDLTNQLNYNNLEWENNALYRYGRNLYANTNYLRYEKSYLLTFDVYTDRNTYTTYDYYYIFYPNNAIIENGVVVNAGSGDYSNQDLSIAINNGINNVIGNINDATQVDSILNDNLKSGDINTMASEFGFSPLDNPFTTFLLHITEGTYDALTLRQNKTLSCDVFGLHFELKSQDFITPESDLKQLIRNILIFLYIYGNYKYFHYLLTLLQTARIDKAIAKLGTDEFYDSDIM